MVNCCSSQVSSAMRPVRWSALAVASNVAEKMIAGVRGMHARVNGTTPGGQAYRANDPELLDWVHVTAAFGFLEAYAAFVRSVGDADRDRFYAEAVPAGRLYGAVGAPA